METKLLLRPHKIFKQISVGFVFCLLWHESRVNQILNLFCFWCGWKKLSSYCIIINWNKFEIHSIFKRKCFLYFSLSKFKTTTVQLRRAPFHTGNFLWILFKKHVTLSIQDSATINYGDSLNMVLHFRRLFLLIVLIMVYSWWKHIIQFLRNIRILRKT